MEAEVGLPTGGVLVQNPLRQVEAKVARREGTGLHLHIHQSEGQATEALLVTDPGLSRALEEDQGQDLDHRLPR